MSILKACFGEERLSKVFWSYAVIGQGVFALAAAIFVAVVFGENHQLLLDLLVTSYSVWSGICVWACARNTDSKLWEYCARIVVLVFLGYLAALTYRDVAYYTAAPTTTGLIQTK